MAKFGVLPDNKLAPGAASPNFTEYGKELLNSAVGGFGSLRPMGKYMNGARCILKINGKLVGFAFQVSWNIQTQQDEIWTIDDWTPYELAPNRISVSGTLGMFHIPGKGPSKELIQSNVLSFMFHKYITIEVRDQQTNELLFLTKRAVITSRQESIASEQLSTIQLQWKAIGWHDEITPALPDGLTGQNTGGGGIVAGAVGAVKSFFS